jgi:hypothetical protein
MAYEHFLNMSGAFNVNHSLLLLSYFSVGMRRVATPFFTALDLSHLDAPF